VKDSGVDDALVLLRGCLDLDVEKRWTVHDILKCSWLRDYAQRFEDVTRSWVSEN
jgi:hypothetical protein